MAYKPTEWVDHVNSGNKYTLINNADGTTNIDYAGEVIQQGTPMSAENFNHMEQGIVEAFQAVDNALNKIEEFIDLLSEKVDKVEGKGLSTEDYTSAEKTKLAGVEAGAQKNSIMGVKGNEETSYRTGNVNITPANIGAAEAGHTHNYAGSSSVGGAAASAVKLNTARIIDGIKFDGSANINHLGTCSTASATIAKVVTCSGFVLTTGAKITVIFTNTNAADGITLNVNNTGAKAVYYFNVAMTYELLKIPANVGVDFIYDGSHWVYCGNQSYVSQATMSDNKFYRLLLSNGATDNQERAGTHKSSKFTANPATGELKATKFTGALNGNATSAATISTTPTVLYTSSVSAKAPDVVLDGLFTKYNLINAIVNGHHTILPMKYIKTLASLPWYAGNGNIYFQYVDDNTMRIHNGLQQSEGSVNSITLILLY